LSALLTSPLSIDKKLFSAATDKLISFTDEFLFADKKSVSNF